MQAGQTGKAGGRQRGSDDENVENILFSIQKVYNLRCEATKDNDDAKQLTAKLFGNSGYGKCCENVKKYRNTSILTDETKIEDKMKTPLYLSEKQIHNETGEVSATEVLSYQSTIKDRKPHHIGVSILQWSKLLFLR